MRARYVLAPAAVLLLFVCGRADLVRGEERGCTDPPCHGVGGSTPTGHPPPTVMACSSCHVPGAGFRKTAHTLDSFEGALPGRETCLECHAALRKRLATSALHDPFRDGPCTTCHTVHRSPFRPLLQKAYPETSYSSYEREVYSLCWSCHEESLATGKFSEEATNFRLGRRNFHFSHLQKRKGITCRACHTPHGSDQQHLLRSDAPSGVSGWIDTMRFESDAGGGTCSGGCHTSISYSR